MRRNACLAYGGVGFSETFNHAGNHEIAAKFHGICLPWFHSGDEGLTTDGVENRLAAIDDIGRSGRDDEQLFRLSGFWPAENRCTHIMLPMFCMLRRQMPCKLRTDGAG